MKNKYKLVAFLLALFMGLPTSLVHAATAVPTNFRYTNRTSTSIRLEWNHVSGYAHYLICSSSNPPAKIEDFVWDTTYNYYDVNGLSPNTTYEFWIKVDSNDGTSYDYLPRTASIYVTTLPATSITSAALSGLVRPVAGGKPIAVSALSTSDPGYAISSITWTPNHTTFGYSTSYQATIELAAKSGYTFTTQFTPSVNTGSSKPGTIGNGGGTFTFAVDFPITESLKSTDAYLSGISVSHGNLTPVFNRDVLTYEVNAGKSDNITITATKNNANATVSGDGWKSLTVGSNTFPIVVTAEDGVTKKTYTVNVTREPLSNDAYLAGLNVNPGQLVPGFNRDVLAYEVNAGKSDNITISATKNNANATVSGDGWKSLDVGSNNAFPIVVTAEDGITKKTYTVNVTREPLSTDTTLSLLSIGSQEIQIVPGKLDYEVSLPFELDSVYIQAVTNHPEAIVISGDGLKDLTTGGTVFNVDLIVLAEDRSTAETYKIKITLEQDPDYVAPFSVLVANAAEQNTIVSKILIRANEDSLKIRYGQNINMAYDNRILRLVGWDGSEISSQPIPGNGFISVARAGNIGVFGDFIIVDNAISVDREIGYISISPTSLISIFDCPKGEYVNLGQVRFAFQPGKNTADLTEDVLRIMNVDELSLLVESGAGVALYEAKGETYTYGSYTQKDKLTAPVFDWTMAFEKINAQQPVIETQPESAALTVGAAHGLNVTSKSLDNGSLSYQWFINTVASNIGGTPVIGATNASYTAAHDAAGTYYYYVVVTNNIEDNGDGGIKTATATSDIAALTFTKIIDPNAPTVKVSNVTGKAGDEVTVAVTLDNHPGIASFYLTMKYDTEKLMYVSAAKGDILDNSFTAIDRGNSNIGISALSSNGSDISDGSTMFTITFKINEGAENGVTALDLGYYGMFDGIESNEKFLSFEINQGLITINNTLYGDINGDGTVNPLDVTRLIRYFSGVDSSTNNFVYDNADVNGDKMLNPLDVTRLIRYFSGVDPSPLGPKAEPALLPMFSAVPLTEGEPIISVSSSSGEPGDEVTLTVALDNNPGIASYYLTMQYDTNKLTYVSAFAGDILNNSFTALNKGNGNIGISALSANGADVFNGSILFTVKFRINEGTENGAAGINLGYYGMFDGIESNEKFLSFGINQGTITVGTVIDEAIEAEQPIIEAQPENAGVTVGEAHSFSVLATAPDNGTLNYQWYNNTSESNVGGTNLGSANGAQTPIFTAVTSTAGNFYYFVEITNVIPDNGDGGRKTATIRSNAVTLSVDDTSSVEPEIKSVAINITTPVIGSTPDSVAVFTDDRFTSGAVSWSPSGAFKANTSYTATVKLTAKEGCSFAKNNLAAVFNSEAATVISNNGKTLTLSYTFKTADSSTADETIDNLALSVTAPVIGSAPSTDVSAADITNFTIGSVSWSPSGNFKVNTPYTVTVKLTANPGYTFTGLSADKVNVNGQTAAIVSNNGKTLTVSYTFPSLTPAADIVIDNAALTVNDLVVGEKPGTSVSFTGDIFTVGTVSWSPSGNVKANTAYTITIKLTANTGYTFTGTSAGDVTVNGQAATIISNNGKSLTLTCTFMPN